MPVPIRPCRDPGSPGPAGTAGRGSFPWRAWLVGTLALLAAIVGLAGSARSQATDSARPADPAISAPGLTLRVAGSGHTAPLRRIALSPDQQTLVSVGDDRSVRVWRVAERRLLQTLWPAAAADGGGRLYGVAFSPAGDEFAVGGDGPAGAAQRNRLYVYRAGNGTLARALDLPPGKVRRMLWTRSGAHLATCTVEPQRFTIVGRTGGVQLDQPLAGPCYALAELPDGTLLTGDASGVVRRFATRDGRWSELPPWTTTGRFVTSLAVSPDGRHVVVGFFDKTDAPATTGVPIVEVLDASTGQSVRTWRFPQIAIGDLRTVAWSADGATILATGSPQRERGSFLAMHIAWPGGRVAESVVASDSLMDALPYGADGFVVAHADTTWSVVRPDAASGAPAVAWRTERQAIDLRGAGSLRLSPDARTVGFATRDGRDPMEFALAGRRLREGQSEQPGPTHSSWRLNVSGWENAVGPSVAGRRIDLGPVDVSRAAAISEDRSAVYLGTNHTLRRLDPDGRTRWQVSPGVETRAVHVSADGRIVVSAMLDGTLRWWRASDGLLLLTLYVQFDGRWVLWTEGGYYDATPGAEPLIGFVRDRRGEPGADFFSVGRFRDARFRPDVIDRVLETLDPALALAQADRERVRVAERLEDAAVKTQVLASVQPVEVEVSPIAGPGLVARPIAETPAVQAPAAQAPAAQAPAAQAPAVQAPAAQAPAAQAPAVQAPAVQAPAAQAPATRPAPDVAPAAQSAMPVPPPVVSLAGDRRLRPQGREVGLDFFLQALGLPATGVEVRVDGRPAEVLRTRLPARQDGATPGRIELRLPERAARITLIAEAGERTSEAVEIDVEWPAPADPPKAARGKQLVVLAIGVSNYKRSDYGNLRYAAKDAQDFAAALAVQQGRLYGSVQTRVLTDAQATRSALLDALDWLRDAVGPEDTAIVFLAGHGINDPSGRYHFLSYDADVERPSQTAVGESQLRGTLTGLRGRVLLFADTCHAGGVVGTGAAAASDFTRMANALSSPDAGVVVFASSTRQQESLERLQDGNGVFTKALLEGLSGRADLLGQGQVTHQGLGYFIAQTVRQRTDGRQTPVYVSPLGNTDYALVALR